jgi:hypothetical protein
MVAPSQPITIAMPPAAAAKPPNPLDKLVASTAPGAELMGEKGPIPAAPALTIAPGLLPLVIKTPPAAPQPALTTMERHPITGAGDLLDRVATLEVHVKAIGPQLAAALAMVSQQVKVPVSGGPASTPPHGPTPPNSL